MDYSVACCDLKVILLQEYAAQSVSSVGVSSAESSDSAHPSFDIVSRSYSYTVNSLTQPAIGILKYAYADSI